MKRNESVQQLKGVGARTAGVLEKLGIVTVEDLLSFYPRDYRRFEEPKLIREITEEETAAVRGSLLRPLTVQYARGLQITSGEISDGISVLKVRWFHMPYLKNTLKPKVPYIFYGKISKKSAGLVMDQPALYQPGQYEELQKVLQPIYMLTKGVSGNTISKLVRQACDMAEPVPDYLPAEIRKKWQLAEYSYAQEKIHFPEDEHHMLLARRRLVFDEFLLFILAVRSFKEDQTQENHCPLFRNGVTDQVIANLDYSLTGAQQRVWEEIQDDVSGNKTMMRLIQGDVGSGKTILAFLGMILAAANQTQSAMMAPTEVLARQHFTSLKSLLDRHGLPYVPVLLTGSMTAKEKREVYEKIASHEADMVIGTHAVIQDKVTFHRLGLVITDEQHRFGVRQRDTLEAKGNLPHTMVMSATPIPRTLAVILYGDLEISIMDEMPAERIPIKNCVVDTSYRKKAYAFIEKEVRKGHQAYVICPMVEESEMIDAEDVENYTKRLRQELPGDLTIASLHGKMKPKEKNEIMERYLKDEIQVLVSTTVVEVGVNVPNATVMMIENAERFGLAQLHQLRGRVGRGKDQSYCIMVSGSDSKKNQKRLEIMNQSNDGFYIAEEDLKLRGPGDLLGVRQSGMMEFKLGDIYTDAQILKDACRAAEELLENDPKLFLAEHQELKKKLQYYMSNDLKKLSL